MTCCDTSATITTAQFDDRVLIDVGEALLRTRSSLQRERWSCELLLAERWLIAARRPRKFFAMEETNHVVRELLDRIS